MSKRRSIILSVTVEGLSQASRSINATVLHTLDGTDHASHSEQASMIRRYIRWHNRSRNARDLVNRANVA